MFLAFFPFDTCLKMGGNWFSIGVIGYGVLFGEDLLDGLGVIFSCWPFEGGDIFCEVNVRYESSDDYFKPVGVVCVLSKNNFVIPLVYIVIRVVCDGCKFTIVCIWVFFDVGGFGEFDSTLQDLIRFVFFCHDVCH